MADVAEFNTQRPYVIYQSVGGAAYNYLEAQPVGLRNARVQIEVYADTRLEVTSVAEAVEDAVITELKASVLSAAISTYNEDLRRYGTQQDFGVWY